MTVGVYSHSRTLPRVPATPHWWHFTGQVPAEVPEAGLAGERTWWRHAVPVPGRVGAQREQHHVHAEGKHSGQARVENEVKQ